MAYQKMFGQGMHGFWKFITTCLLVFQGIPFSLLGQLIIWILNRSNSCTDWMKGRFEEIGVFWIRKKDILDGEIIDLDGKDWLIKVDFVK